MAQTDPQLTWLTGMPIMPKVGGCYTLRAGLQCFIERQFLFYDMPMFRGVLIDGRHNGTILWHLTGHYSPMKQPHELDIIAEIGNE